METLNGAGIVVTRPTDRGQGLCRRIAAAGGRSLAFPTLDIEPVTPPVIAMEERHMVEQHRDERPVDILVFSSVPAVEHGLDALRSYIGPSSQIAAIGNATTAALQAAGFATVISPEERQESEGLLSLDEFKDIHRKRILLIKGRGGRDLLHRELTARGAVVGTAIVYERRTARQSVQPLLHWWRNKQVDAIVTSSQAGLESLHEMLDEEGRSFLANTLVVVPTTRMIKLVRRLGIQVEPVIASGASDDAIMQALETWWRSSETGRQQDFE